MQIKDRCWQIEGETTSYFLKKYIEQRTFEKVRTLQQQLQDQLLFLAPAIAYHEPFIVYEWLNATAVNYREQKHCQAVYALLTQFHEAGQSLAFRLPTLQLEAKWHYRLMQFESLEKILVPILQHDFYNIVRIATYALQKSCFPKESVTALHGDVAHHNFLKDDMNNFYMIDLDLSAAGSAAEEFILWMHRLLPHHRFNVHDVLEIVPQLACYERYFSLLLFPNELLREWLFFYGEKRMYPYLLELTEQTLEYWPRLHEQVQMYAS